MAHDGDAKDYSRSVLVDVRRALLHLHKTLLEWERAAYERFHGRVSNTELLRLILNDPQFRWLRPMSELLVRIDETLEIDDPPATREDIERLIAAARTLVNPDEAGTAAAQRYHAALQDSPDAVLAHRQVHTVLKNAR
jgi:hypothetical protein